ncbi:hypothetical protein KOM00_00805 [Geomonas sp. Red69]|uniref:Lipoprotein n=1 Tax=Geomonas diazotrophica TaxID=2843197 RepID=A0ABX8JM04_9BACT|nr:MULTISPECIES: hypothetical protein [Geomonas]MBU5635269.1 hypothetical protein [Geomonas diazotrophica]QWV97677.1 hypothetical protein KP005_20485 [Geomonas nitrogeniifigens]QXE86814.1 hypothetical protein KP003_21115 [Geomonas nitrogeniifigens]
MKRRILWLVFAVVLVALAGCGSSDRPLIETTISSDPAVDGDIVDAAGVRTVSLVNRDGLPGVLAGVDPVNDDVYRAFLHFPLTRVPANHAISSATLSVVIRSVTVVPPTATIPLRIELVSFDPPIITNDFDRAILLPLAATVVSPPITSADVNREVNIDVTSLMAEAQFRGLPDFQVRILQDNDLLTTVPGIVEIDEATVANEPRLTVVHF